MLQQKDKLNTAAKKCNGLDKINKYFSVIVFNLITLFYSDIIKFCKEFPYKKII